MNKNRVLLTGASIVTAEKAGQGALLIDGETIAGVWFFDEDGLAEYESEKVSPETLQSRVNADVTRDLSGKLLMAGAIDAHVHFREPGMTQKADMATESRAALLGGVTSFIDMPNTVPATVSLQELEKKCSLAEGRCHANWGFHIGADNVNADNIKEYLERCNDSRAFASVKVFMGSSTGNMLVDRQETLDKLFSISGSRIFIHSEDEAIIKANLADAKQKFGENIPMREHENIRSRQACIRSTIKALELAMKHGTALHICHVSTAEEVEMIRAAKQYNPEITAETSANYLWFCDEDYDRLGSRVKCNPSIKTATDRAALRNALKDGVIDTIGSDHAPHLKEEKARPYLSCPSGMPSIQQEVAVLLTVADEEQIPLTRIASVLSEKISDMLGIVGRGKIQTGYKADLIIIDPKKEFTVGGSNEGNAGLAYKCGWSPYEGSSLKGMVEDVYLNGTLTVQNGHLITETAAGQRLEFRNR